MAFVKLDPALFADDGVDFSFRERRPRIIGAVDGKDKSGKSDFCYDAPDPIFMLSFDFGDEDVVQKYQAGEVAGIPRQIVIKDFKWEIPQQFRGKVYIKGDNDLAKWVTENVWAPSVDLYHRAMESGMFRTIVIDKATEWWQICRMGVFGRHTSTNQALITESNGRWRDVIRDAATSTHPVNLLLIHEQKPEWVVKNMRAKDGEGTEERWAPSGGWVRDGNEKVPFLIQYGFETRYVRAVKHAVSGEVLEQPRFELEVKVARGHPEQLGNVYTLAEYDPEKKNALGGEGDFNRRMGWLDVVSSLRPEIPLEDWGHATLR